jgi:hypothetical protein
MFSIFGWLDRIAWWRNLPYPTKSALLRAMKAGLSVAIGILLAAATGGILFPVEWNPMVVLIITSVLQAVDKFLRETDIAKGVAVSDSALGPEEYDDSDSNPANPTGQ